MSTPPAPVEATTWLPVSPDEAFRLVTDPRRLRRWLMVAGRIDLRVGGDVHLVVAPGAHAVGRVTEVEPGRRFAYTHGWVGDDDLPPGSTEVSVTLEPHDGGITVTVHHRGIPADAREGMQHGWDDFMHRLSRLAGGHEPGADWPAALEVSTPEAVLDAALFALLSSLRSAAGTAGDTSTPCAGFTLDDLRDHLVENATMLASVLSVEDPEAGQGPPPTEDAEDGEDAVAHVLWPVVEAAQALEGHTRILIGATSVMAEDLVRFLSVELLVHAWDITRTTGGRLEASPELCAAVWENARRNRPGPFFDDEQFDPPVRAAEDASALHRLLALTGRHPGETTRDPGGHAQGGIG